MKSMTECKVARDDLVRAIQRDHPKLKVEVKIVLHSFPDGSRDLALNIIEKEQFPGNWTTYWNGFSVIVRRYDGGRFS
jgi:Tat protein secretion system quality control protein TatD with DNase activity